MKLDDAEKMAVQKFREILDAEYELMKQNRERFIVCTGPIQDAWEVSLVVFPLTKTDDFWDCSEKSRGKEWVRAIVNKSGEVEVYKLAKLEDLLGVESGDSVEPEE